MLSFNIEHVGGGWWVVGGGWWLVGGGWWVVGGRWWMGNGGSLSFKIQVYDVCKITKICKNDVSFKIIIIFIPYTC